MNPTWDGLLDHTRDWLAARNLLIPDAGWVVGASGGADSTLLLHVLVALARREQTRWRIHAAHFHHGMRPGHDDEDARCVSDLADELSIPFYSERTDVRAIVARDGGSTEEVARKLRYDFLERAALKSASELVAVGHHADDNAETVLHRICRGTGLRGLIGIHDVRPIRPDSHIRLARPLLALRRTAIDQICVQRGLRPRTDASNHTHEFTRGKIRNAVMPALRDLLNPQVDDALLRLSEHARWLGSYLEDAAARIFDSLVVSEGPGFVVLNVRALLSKQRIIQAEVARRAISIVLRGEQDLGFAHIDAILRLAEDPTSGKEIHVPGPIVVRKLYDRLEFRPLDAREELVELEPVSISCPGRTPLPALGYELRADVLNFSAEQLQVVCQNSNRCEEWLDFDRLTPPLIVRGRRDGDRFRPLGGPGAKTIGDFFTERKIDPQVRSRVGLLCDQVGVLWVMPLRIDERAKLRIGTRRALRLALTPLPQV